MYKNRLQNAKKYDRIIKQFWRDVRAVECARLESGYALTGHRRFKSCSLRQAKPKSNTRVFGLGFYFLMRKRSFMKWVYETNDDNSARFVLGQIFNDVGKTLLCFGINPSTACPMCIDNTIRKIISICANNGYDNWIMLNIYPQRATNPDSIHLQCDENLTAQNMLHIKSIVEKYTDSDVLLAYGNLITKRKYLKKCLDEILNELVTKRDKKLKVIKITKKGNPVHPLYQPNSVRLCDYKI